MSADRSTTTAPADEFELGLAHDLGTLVARRGMLAMLAGGAAALTLAACGASSSDGSTSTTAAATTAGSGAAATSGTSTSPTGDTIPEETAGPYPGDGSNGPNVLAEDGVVRSDVTASFAGSSGTAEGTALVIAFAVTDTGGTARPGLAVYAWHADAEGRYSMYSSGVEDQNYLRGVQETDSTGTASFTSIFPGCYDGRWPHIHFEVYESVDDALGGASPVATSQIALPADTCAEVYGADDRYSTSVSNLQRVSLERDMVFADSYQDELGTVSGSRGDGLTVTLAVPV